MAAQGMAGSIEIQNYARRSGGGGMCVAILPLRHYLFWAIPRDESKSKASLLQTPVWVSSVNNVSFSKYENRVDSNHVEHAKVR